MGHHILFYIDGCGYCERVLPEIVDFYTRRAIPLVIRKPTLVERPAILGYPALLVPEKAGGKPILLIGTNIVDALRKNPEILNGSTNHSLPKPASGDDNAGVSL